MTKEALKLATEMERGQFSTTLLPAAAELRRLHKENRKLRAQEALDRKAENARELGLDYEPEQEQRNVTEQEHDVLMNSIKASSTIVSKGFLAQPEQEPVALYVYKPTLPRGHLGNVSDGDLPWVYDQDPSSGYSARMLVYTTPPQRKPLSDEEIMDLCRSLPTTQYTTAFARAIEAAHGIKETNT